jgi:A/G-specific adenine glycosylase
MLGRAWYYTRARLPQPNTSSSIAAAGINADDWQAAPDGRYTAGAIASIARHERVPVLDGNVIRVLSRVMAL